MMKKLKVLTIIIIISILLLSGCVNRVDHMRALEKKGVSYYYTPNDHIFFVLRPEGWRLEEFSGENSYYVEWSIPVPDFKGIEIENEN